MTMSPTRPNFHQNCRLYPSLISSCTVDWYEKWPEEALLIVADTFLREKVDIKNREVNITPLKKSNASEDFNLLSESTNTTSLNDNEP